jgi:hypothetical protein
LLDNVRIYFLAGLQHFTPPFPPARDNDRGLAPAYVPNPNPVRRSSREDYLQKFSDRARNLAADRFLLTEDVDALIKRAGEEWDLVTK